MNVRSPLRWAMITALIGCSTVWSFWRPLQLNVEAQQRVTSRKAPKLTIGRLGFRDLNRNGQLDPYEDWRRTTAERTRDLVRRMTLEEKAGAMMHGTLRADGPLGSIGAGTRYDLTAVRGLIDQAKVNSFITRLRGTPRELAEQSNLLQELAEESRLGIPLTISTDPRHHFQYVLGANESGNGFSQWPETLGLAAIGEPALTRRFGDIARQEYRAVGIHMALSPQADLATEPRWSRTVGTFGEDARLTRRMVESYITGFQNGATGLNLGSVITVVKHWVGYGAQPEGFDGHSAYGKYSNFPGRNFSYHIIPFTGAFAAGVAGVMPTYPIPRDVVLHGRRLEQVGAGFSRQLLTEELRGRYGFRGVILSDWAITNDCTGPCVDGLPAGEVPTPAHIGMPWGVEGLTRIERFIKGVEAGLDQFGGVEETSLLVEAVRAGRLTEARLDQSVTRIMRQKFELGLFDNPYVELAKAEALFANRRFISAGRVAQSRAIVLLENRQQILPLRPASTDRPQRLFLYKIDPAVARANGFTVVERLEDADLAILRVVAPFETLHPGYFFGLRQHEGDLRFIDGHPDYEVIKAASAKVPTIVSIYLDRPAILTNVREKSSALLANFGVSDPALFDVLLGRVPPQGRLPFELPSSMDEVRAQAEDRPYDTPHPLYRFGSGMRYRHR